MATDYAGNYVADPVQHLKNLYSTDPLGYNAAISHQGDMDELAASAQNPYAPSNFLGGPGGVIAHQMQTVFDAANLQGQAQGGQNAKFNPKALPGQPPMPSTSGPMQGLENADPSSPNDPINQWRKQQPQPQASAAQITW